MKTLTTIVTAVLGVLVGATAVRAAATAGPDLQSVPAECRAVAEAPASAQIERPVAAAKTSAADCEAEVALREAKGPPTDASVNSLVANLKPSLALLDDAIANGDLESQIVATHAKADLLIGLGVQVTGSVGRVGSMTGSDLSEYLRQIDQAHALTDSWREQGLATYRDLDQLMNTPDAKKLADSNPVIMSISHQVANAPTR